MTSAEYESARLKVGLWWFLYLFNTADRCDFTVILQNYFDDLELFGEGGEDNMVIVLGCCFRVCFRSYQLLWSSGIPSVLDGIFRLKG